MNLLRPFARVFAISAASIIDAAKAAGKELGTNTGRRALRNGAALVVSLLLAPCSLLSQQTTTLYDVSSDDLVRGPVSLKALSTLTPAADKLPYFTSASAAANTDFTAFARTLLDDADNTAARSTLGLVIGTNVQAYDSALDGFGATAGLIVQGNATNTTFVFEGDSMMAGNALPVGQDFPTAAMLSPAFLDHGTKYNVAAGGDGLADIVADYATEVYPRRPTGSVTRSFLFVWIGANDYAAATPATYIADLESYWSTAKADGFTIVAFTITRNYATATPAYETNRVSINNYIRRSRVWDYLVDADVIFSDNTDPDLIFTDDRHPSYEGNKFLARYLANTMLAGGGIRPTAGVVAKVGLTPNKAIVTDDTGRLVDSVNITLDSSGYVSSITFSDVVISRTAAGTISVTSGSGAVLSVGNATIGTINLGGTNITKATGAGFKFSTDLWPSSDGGANLGSGSFRWANIRNSGTTISDSYLQSNATDEATGPATGSGRFAGGIYVAKNVYTPQTFIGGVQALSGAGAISVTTAHTDFTSTGGAQALTLANGTAGQVKTISHVTDGGSGVLTPTTKTGYTTITFTNAGDSVTLRYSATGGWYIIGIYGAVAA